MGTLLLREHQRLSYSLMGAKGNPVVESFFGRFKGEARDLFLEAKTLEELRGVIAERIRYPVLRGEPAAHGARVPDAGGGDGRGACQDQGEDHTGGG